jgi:DNA-binding transcriptional LysR family regulator
MKSFNPSGITLHQIQIFLTAAEELNFSRAAVKLNVTQPYVSNIISRLEETLEMRLFVRLLRGVTLTSAGQSLYDGWHDTYDRISAAVDNASLVREDAENTLTVADDIVLDKNKYLYPILSLFKTRFSHINLNVQQAAAVHTAHVLKTLSADVGFAPFGEFPRFDDKPFKWKILARCNTCFDVPPSMPVYDKNELTMSDLDGLPIVLQAYEEDSNYNRAVLQLFQDNGITPLIRSYDSRDSILFMRNISDILVLCNSFVQPPERPDIRRIPIRGTTDGLIIAWNECNPKKIVKNFIDIAVEYFTDANTKPDRVKHTDRSGGRNNRRFP